MLRHESPGIAERNKLWFAKPSVLLMLAVAPLLLAQGHGGEKASPIQAQQSAVAQARPAANGPGASSARNDHVGKPLPEYMTGDQCLFCHRNVVGPTWEREPHAWTIREIGVEPSIPQVPKDATHIIGSPQHYRALKLIGYGKFAILADDGKTWQPDVFATRCAGCHTTGVDPTTHAFSAYAFDCYACHGEVSAEHTTKPELAWLGSKRPRDPKAIVAICAQCHLRGGKSQSTGLPYPNNFIAGDDLFIDFKVDLKLAYDPAMNPADRHAYAYASRVLAGQSKQTCLECHRVHGKPELKHQYCIDCDDLPEAARNAGKHLHSETCQY
jgi:hypothetical protein